jgi:hypothetical protein
VACHGYVGLLVSNPHVYTLRERRRAPGLDHLAANRRIPLAFDLSDHDVGRRQSRGAATGAATRRRRLGHGTRLTAAAALASPFRTSARLSHSAFNRLLQTLLAQCKRRAEDGLHKQQYREHHTSHDEFFPSDAMAFSRTAQCPRKPSMLVNTTQTMPG